MEGGKSREPGPLVFVHMLTHATPCMLTQNEAPPGQRGHGDRSLSLQAPIRASSDKKEPKKLAMAESASVAPRSFLGSLQAKVEAWLTGCLAEGLAFRRFESPSGQIIWVSSRSKNLNAGVFCLQPSRAVLIPNAQRQELFLSGDTTLFVLAASTGNGLGLGRNLSAIKSLKSC